jgi:hypothetical protein
VERKTSQRQLECFESVMKTKGLQNTVDTDNLCGQKGRGAYKSVENNKG